MLGASASQDLAQKKTRCGISRHRCLPSGLMRLPCFEEELREMAVPGEAETSESMYEEKAGAACMFFFSCGQSVKVREILIFEIFSFFSTTLCFL
jgi:hypothetical protein